MSAFQIAVVAHRDRRPAAIALVDKVEALGANFDDGTLGCEGNHRKVWDWHSTAASYDWSVVLEDDAQPIDGFRDQLTAALAVAPAPIVSLYLGRVRPLGAWQGRIRLATTEASHRGASWILSNHCLHAVAIAMRTELIADMLDWTEGCGLVADDAITAWAQHAGHDIAYTWPSLVNHHDGPTITDHADGKKRKPGRVAWAVGSRRRWNSKTVEMRGHPLRAHTRSIR